MVDAWPCCTERWKQGRVWGRAAADEIGQVLKKMQRSLSGGISKGCYLEASQVSATLEETQMRKQASGTLRVLNLLVSGTGAWDEAPSPVPAFSDS